MEEEKRAKLVVVDPNPGFMKCLEKLMEEALLKQDEKKVEKIILAMESVRKFPVALSSLTDARILDFISADLLNEILAKSLEETTEEPTPADGIVLEECKGFEESDIFKFIDIADASCFAPEFGMPTGEAVEPSAGSSGGARQALPAAPLESFRVIMYADTQERGVIDGLQQKFDEEGLQFAVRRLKVGDFAWVVHSAGLELLLPMIVERKRLDDLVKSIKDGRLHDQRFRLMTMRIPKMTFLIEEHQVQDQPKGTRQAVYSILARNKFSVMETESPDQTIAALVNLTKLFNSKLQLKTIRRSDEFNCNEDSDTWYLPEFYGFFERNGKLRDHLCRDLFTKQLVQQHSLSADKACAISAVYGSPKSLIEAFQAGGPYILAYLKYGLLQKNIGRQISSTLYKFYLS